MEDAYKQGTHDAWNLFAKIRNLRGPEFMTVFGNHFESLSYEECRERMEQYEEKKKDWCRK